MGLFNFFKKEEEVVEVEPVERRPVDELMGDIEAIKAQFLLVLGDVNKQEEVMKGLEEELENRRLCILDLEAVILKLQAEKKALEERLERINKICDNEE